MLDLFKRSRNKVFLNEEKEDGMILALKKIIHYVEKNPLTETRLTGLNDTEKTGPNRHFPPATKEWVDSTYSYNKNYIKTLAVADDNVNKLIKGYLNMNRLINNRRSKRVAIRFKRLSLNKILVSKAEVKHTNSKAVITVYLYNRNKKFFLYKLKKLYSFGPIFLNNIWTKKVSARTKALNKRKSRRLDRKVYRLKKKVNFVSLRAIKLINKAKKHKNLLFKTLYWDNANFLHYRNKYYKRFTKNAYEIELLYMYYTKMLTLNNNKFKNWFLLGLKKAVSKLYNKKVEFNFVSLKYLHLNSNIFTESIVTRIRNRNNSLMAVLIKALKLAKIPSRNYNLEYRTLNNSAITPLVKNHTNDVLHGLLHNLYAAQHAEKNQNTLSLLEADKLNNKQISILHAIKHKTVLGVRLEATGRLSKRLTASRSVFKLRYKGGLKNVDYSRKDMSSVMLRGNAKPNVQYTVINNKTRNGSFGLKGWISGY